MRSNNRNCTRQYSLKPDWIMLKKMLLTVILLIASPLAMSATFQVTSPNCTGPGSLLEAVQQANTTPGADVIEVNAGPVISGKCGNVAYGDSIFEVTESLTIKGNSTVFQGSNLYFSDSSGDVNPLDTAFTCPSNINNGYTLAGLTGSMFMVGQRDTDNTGIELIIEDLEVNAVSQLASVRLDASLTLRNINATDIRDLEQCSRAAIQAFGKANVTMENVNMRGLTDFQTLPDGIILGEEGKLEVYDSYFFNAIGRYAIVWAGDVDIVSTQFNSVGGMWNSGIGIARVINSLFLPAGASNQRRFSDGFLVSGGGAIIFQASTVVYHVNECEPFPSLNCVWDGSVTSTATFQALFGTIGFEQSVVHVQTLNPLVSPSATPLLEAISPGFFFADALSFIQPLAWQDATELRAITNQADLLTGPDALPASNETLGFLITSYPDSVTPIITGAATLVDKIADAGAGGTNELKDPRGNVISKDILGNPRVDSGTRSIGAVQNNVIPHLDVNSNADDFYTAILSWNQPTSPGITGYDVCHGTGAPPDPVGIGTSCPGTLIEGFTSEATETQGTIENLSPGSSNWFLVRAFAGSTKEGWSNVAKLTAPVIVTYPPAVISNSSSVNILPAVTGTLVDPLYLVNSGTLPVGLTLDPNTGAITGRATSGCDSIVGLLVIDANGTLANSTITFTCGAVPVPTLSGSRLLLLIVLLAGLGWVGRRSQAHC